MKKVFILLLVLSLLGLNLNYSFAQQAGAIDPTFIVGTGCGGNTVNAISSQPDGKVIIGGNFGLYNGTLINKIARIKTDGKLDLTFNIGTGFKKDVVYCLAIQPDGKIIAGGNFTIFNNDSAKYVVRINPNGTRDATFSTGSIFDKFGGDVTINCIGIQPDGKIIVGGHFGSNIGSNLVKNCLIRLNADGSLDTSFNATPYRGFYTSAYVNSIHLQNDGKILVGGNLTSYNTKPIDNIIRLNSNGTQDTSFKQRGTGVNGKVRVIKVRPNGKIILGGDFNKVNDVYNFGITQLNADGSIDTMYNILRVSKEFNSGVLDILLQPYGKILTCGTFSSYNYITRNGIARLNEDWSLDTTFNPGTGAGGLNPNILSMVLGGSDKLVIGGGFTDYNGSNRSGIARILLGNIVGVDDMNGKPKLTIYPNPSKGEINIQSEEVVSKIILIDALGKKVYEEDINQSNIRLNNLNLNHGIYFISVTLKSGNIITSKVLINNL